MDDSKKLLSLYHILASLNSDKEVEKFMKDLCTPQELKDMEGRWRICKPLNTNNLSYREIHSITGESLTTICRVARFLRDEKNNGYTHALKKIHIRENKE